MAYKHPEYNYEANSLLVFVYGNQYCLSVCS